jgi:hypothetical protein
MRLDQRMYFWRSLTLWQLKDDTKEEKAWWEREINLQKKRKSGLSLMTSLFSLPFCFFISEAFLFYYCTPCFEKGKKRKINARGKTALESARTKGYLSLCGICISTCPHGRAACTWPYGEQCAFVEGQIEFSLLALLVYGEAWCDAQQWSSRKRSELSLGSLVWE